MNRLATFDTCRALGLATALWLMVLSNGSAQTTPRIPAASTQGTPAASPEIAQETILQVRSAISSRDFQTAVTKYRQLAAMAGKLPKIRPEVAKLRVDLQVAGIDSELLAMSPSAGTPTESATSMARLPDIIDASPITEANNTSQKREALRLIAIGRAALDRGDASTALNVARQAQALNVPEKEFAPGEPRVWQFVLDAESAARRSGVGQNASGPISPNQKGSVSNAGYQVPAYEDQGVIAQTLFQTDNTDQPASDASQKSNPSIRQVQAQEITATPLAPRDLTPPEPVNIAPTSPASFGQLLYQQGLDALTAGDKELARKRFVEAWKYEAELDLTTRRQLKDKLTLLQPSRLPAAGATAENPNRPLTAIEKAELEAEQITRRLYREITSELAAVNEIKASEPLDALDQLNRLRRRVDGSNIDDSSKRALVTMVDRALAEQQQFVESNRAQIELDLQNEAIRTQMATDDAREARIDDEIAALVETFNELMEEQRYPEAEVIAKQVGELKPGTAIATSMFHASRMGTRIQLADEIQAQKEDSYVRNMRDLEASAISMDPSRPLDFGDARIWDDLSSRRLQQRGDDSRISAAEKEIQSKLHNEVELNYQQRPLGEVMEDLSALTGIPIVLNNNALSAVKVNADTPVSLKLPQAVSLKSALNLILENLELTYLIDNDVLNITSIEAKQSNTYPQVYRVTDLVTPIPNFTSSYEDGLAGALRAAYQMSNPQTDVQIVPVSATDLGMGMANSMSPSQMSPNMLGQYAPMGSAGSFGASNPPTGGRGGGSFADFQSLMDLIQTTVVPDTWEALGGPSTMAPYPQNLSLVISTTSDVHDQIADLLDSLRRLQNLQITIEVRFITLSDRFFEQIGVDFNVQFDDNVTEIPEDDSGPSVTIGIGADRLPTAQFDVEFNQNNFNISPAFGAPDAGAFSTLGFAILSDIEAFFFLQAAQGDSRANVMQAPKVTLFDGQIATISDVTQRPFVTSITPVVGDFAVAQQPVIVVLNEGTQLNVQGIVSDDRRFVRLTLVPFFSQIGDVDTFTFEGTRRTSRSTRAEEDTNGDGVVDENDAVDTEAEEDIITGTTVQLPTFAFTNVSTTVSVPDGGTILLGGIKRMAESRTERGLPILSKIPYVSRLFRNTAVGRDASSLMLMVTPRIIIQEEEELAQTGYEPPR